MACVTAGLSSDGAGTYPGSAHTGPACTSARTGYPEPAGPVSLRLPHEESAMASSRAAPMSVCHFGSRLDHTCPTTLWVSCARKHLSVASPHL